MIDIITQTNSFLKAYNAGTLDDETTKLWYKYAVSVGHKLIFNKTKTNDDDYLEMYANFVKNFRKAIVAVENISKERMSQSEYNIYYNDIISMFYSDLKTLNEIHLTDQVFFDSMYKEYLEILLLLKEETVI